MSARQQGGGAQIAHGQVDLPGQAQRLMTAQRLHIDDPPLKLKPPQCFNHETSMMELLSVAENIGYMHRNLRRFMRPQRRFASFTFGPGSARILYQPLGVVGVMAPWNYPAVLAVAPLVTALAALVTPSP